MAGAQIILKAHAYAGGRRARRKCGAFRASFAALCAVPRAPACGGQCTRIVVIFARCPRRPQGMRRLRRGMNGGGQGAGGHYRTIRAPNRILYGGRPRGRPLKWGFDTGKRLPESGQEGSAYNDRGGQEGSAYNDRGHPITGKMVVHTMTEAGN